MASHKVAEYARKMREKKQAEEKQKSKAPERKRPTSYMLSSSLNTGGASSKKSNSTSDSTSTSTKKSSSTKKSNSNTNKTSRIPKRATGAGAGGGQSASTSAGAEERRQREQALAKHRTPAEVQTFTMDHFVQGVVEWDIFGEIHAEANGTRSAWEEKSGLPNVSVPNSFRSAQEYARVWTPLLVREARAQTLSELVGSDGWQRQTVMEVGIADSASLSAGRSDLKLTDIHPEFNELKVGKKIKANHSGGSPQVFTEHELLLFMAEPDAMRTAIGGKGAQSPKGFLGVVSSATRTREGLAVRVSMGMLKRHRPKDRRMHCMTLGSLRPTLREYDSITGLGRVLLRNNLLSGKATGSDGNLVDNLGGPFVEWLENKFNDSQKQAIRVGANGQGFTLIKGPPGTGKTTTLKALLNALHQREYNRYYDKLLSLARVKPEDTPAAWEKLKHFAPHILITAPSNVAVDNIVSRILEEGFLDGEAGRYNPSMVRVGSGNVGNQVQPVALQAQVSAALMQTARELAARVEMINTQMLELRTAVNCSLELLRALINACQHELPFGWEARVDRNTFVAFFVDHANQRTTLEPPDPPSPGPGVRTVPVESMPEYRVYAQHLTRDLELYERLNKEHRRLSFAARAQMEVREHAVRQSLEVTLLDEAHLVFSTLNSSGLPCMDQTAPFEVLVVDEAAQSVEVSTIIPLRLGCRHCVLVGDPNQLPATVFSQGGKLSQYDRSLFQRLEANDHPVHLLDIQYRMHPTISAFPSTTFYDGKLKDGPNVKLVTYDRAFHTHPIFQPFVFFDLTSGRQKRLGGGSLSNAPEAQLAVNLYLTLKRWFGGFGSPGSGDEHGLVGRVGVISPYAKQISVLRDKFKEGLGFAWQEEVEISTVDAFQGREKDVIIVSTVRAAGSRGIGFLADVRRMNVALTRARHGLFVVGSAEALSVNPKWSELVGLARSRGSLVKVADPKCDLLTLSAERGSSAWSPLAGTPRMLPFSAPNAQRLDVREGCGNPRAGAGEEARSGQDEGEGKRNHRQVIDSVPQQAVHAPLLPGEHAQVTVPHQEPSLGIAGVAQGEGFRATAVVSQVVRAENGGFRPHTPSPPPPPPPPPSLLPHQGLQELQVAAGGEVRSDDIKRDGCVIESGPAGIGSVGIAGASTTATNPPPSLAKPRPRPPPGLPPSQRPRPPPGPPPSQRIPPRVAASAPKARVATPDTSQNRSGDPRPRPPPYPRPRPPSDPRVSAKKQPGTATPPKSGAPKPPTSPPPLPPPPPPPPPPHLSSKAPSPPPLAVSDASKATPTPSIAPLTALATLAASAVKPPNDPRPRPPEHPRGGIANLVGESSGCGQLVPSSTTGGISAQAGGFLAPPSTLALPPPPPPPPPQQFMGPQSPSFPNHGVAPSASDGDVRTAVITRPQPRSPPPQDPRKRDKRAVDEKGATGEQEASHETAQEDDFTADGAPTLADDGNTKGCSGESIQSGRKRSRIEYNADAEYEEDSVLASPAGGQVRAPVAAAVSPGILQTGGEYSRHAPNLNPSPNRMLQAGLDESLVGTDHNSVARSSGLMRVGRGYLGDGSGSLDFTSNGGGREEVGGWSAGPEQGAWAAGVGVQANTTSGQGGSASWGSWPDEGERMQPAAESSAEENQGNEQSHEEEESEGEGPFSDEEEGEIFLPGNS